MKSTGVVRRIDDLGRIVIPKEIRRNLKIRDGENMEIFIDLDAIILKKYSKLESAISLSEKLAKMVYELTGFSVLITDREQIIAAEKDLAELKNTSVSNELIKLMDDRASLTSSELQAINITKNTKMEGYFYIVPLISSADSIGLILIYDKEPLNQSVAIFAKILSFLICNQVDIG